MFRLLHEALIDAVQAGRASDAYTLSVQLTRWAR